MTIPLAAPGRPRLRTGLREIARFLRPPFSFMDFGRNLQEKGVGLVRREAGMVEVFSCLYKNGGFRVREIER